MATRFTSQQLRFFIETSRGKTYTVAVVTSLLIIGLVLFAVFPAVNSIFTQLKENEERMDAISRIDAKRLAIRQLLAKEQAGRAVSIGLSKSLPDTLDQKTFIQDLLDNSEAVGAHLSSVRFVPVESRIDSFADFDFDIGVLDGEIVSISVDGTSGQLYNFVKNLEDARRIVNIKNVSVTLRQTTVQGAFDPQIPLRMNIQAEIYFWNRAKLEEV